jgi:hypothetical protein
MKRDVIAFNWGYKKEETTEQHCRRFVDLASQKAQSCSIPFPFTLAVVRASSIQGTVVLLVIEPEVDVPEYTSFEKPLTAIYRWLWENIPEDAKWDDSDNFHQITDPLDAYFPGLVIIQAKRIGTLSQHCPSVSPETAMMVFRIKRSGILNIKNSEALLKTVLTRLVHITQDNSPKHANDAGDVIIFMEGVLMDFSTTNIGTFRYHVTRAIQNRVLDSKALEQLMTRQFDELEYQPWVLLARVDPGQNIEQIMSRITGTELPELIGYWTLSNAYSEMDNFLFLVREVHLCGCLLVRLGDRRYTWLPKNLVELSDQEMSDLELTRIDQE